MRLAGLFLLVAVTIGLTALAVPAIPIQAAACSSNFKLTVVPATATVTRGSGVLATIHATGATCATGSRVLLGASVSPALTNGPSLRLPSYSATINLSTPYLVVSTTQSTPTGTFTITVTGEGVQSPIVGVVRQATLTLSVT